VLELLFSAGLVAALRSLEPRKLITCPGFAVGHRLIIGAKGHSGTPKTVALSPILCNFWLLDVPIRALDGPPPQQQGAFQIRLPSWQPLFWHFEFPSHRIRLYVLLIPSLQAVTSYYHNSLLLCTCRRCGQEYPPNAEQARRPHGPETERTRRSTTTKDLGTGSSTPSRSCRTSSTQIKDQMPARILPGPHRAT